MQEFKTVTQVSREYSVSARMLRHYEKMGLIESQRREDYSYRIYDADTIGRIRIILLLRKLRMPLNEIKVILSTENQEEILNVLHKRVSMMNDEIEALSTIRSALLTLVSKYRENCGEYHLLEDLDAVAMIDSLVPANNQIQEAVNMSDLNKANEILSKDMNVRIIQLPECEVASYKAIGDNPEEVVGDKVSAFIQERKLFTLKPDARMFGFNSPNPGVLPNGQHGYEDWITIPKGLELPEGFERKTMPGGLYAAFTIKFPEFHLWEDLIRWAETNDKYEPDWKSGPENMHGMLEEHLNWIYSAQMGWPENGIDGQIDLLLPIKLK